MAPPESLPPAHPGDETTGAAAIDLRMCSTDDPGSVRGRSSSPGHTESRTDGRCATSASRKLTSKAGSASPATRCTGMSTSTSQRASRPPRRMTWRNVSEYDDQEWRTPSSARVTAGQGGGLERGALPTWDECSTPTRRPPWRRACRVRRAVRAGPCQRAAAGRGLGRGTTGARSRRWPRRGRDAARRGAARPRSRGSALPPRRVADRPPRPGTQRQRRRGRRRCSPTPASGSHRGRGDRGPRADGPWRGRRTPLPRTGRNQPVRATSTGGPSPSARAVRVPRCNRPAAGVHSMRARRRCSRRVRCPSTPTQTMPTIARPHGRLRRAHKNGEPTHSTPLECQESDADSLGRITPGRPPAGGRGLSAGTSRRRIPAALRRAPQGRPAHHAAR